MTDNRQSNHAPIRVFLVDDQTMIRAGFRSLIARDPRFEIVGDSGDPRAAIDLVAKLAPDVIVLDISMPGLSGIDAITHYRRVQPKVRILMLTHHEGESFVNQAFSAGADGYLSKDSEQGELLLAIEAVHRGNPFISPKVAGSLLHRGAPAKQGASDTPGGHLTSGTTRVDALTPREREVFQLLALGKSNKEIATALAMSLGTAKKHRENLQRKLDCHSPAEMARLAIREGLLES
jgi:DNA-binding NarL/FixJ family response regulator